MSKGGNSDNTEKNPQSKARTNDKLDPHMAPGLNQSQATLVGGKCSCHYAIPALKIHEMTEFIAIGACSATLALIITPCRSLCTCLVSLRQVIHA